VKTAGKMHCAGDAGTANFRADSRPVYSLSKCVSGTSWGNGWSIVFFGPVQVESHNPDARLQSLPFLALSASGPRHIGIRPFDPHGDFPYDPAPQGLRKMPALLFRNFELVVVWVIQRIVDPDGSHEIKNLPPVAGGETVALDSETGIGRLIPIDQVRQNSLQRQNPELCKRCRIPQLPWTRRWCAGVKIRYPRAKVGDNLGAVVECKVPMITFLDSKLQMRSVEYPRDFSSETPGLVRENQRVGAG